MENLGTLVASSGDGFISWRDLDDVFVKDSEQQANLRTAPKLTYTALHPGHNKQNVNVALSIFHETTIAAFKSYFPARIDIIGFLSLINQWWTVVNSKTRYHPYPSGNAIVENDRKLNFLLSFSNWLENWSKSGCLTYCLSQQTSNAMVQTRQSQILLVKTLFQEGYEFIIMPRLQSDPIEKRFS